MTQPISGAVERASHREGKAFETFFSRLLIAGTKSCFERDILRLNKEALWATWKIQAELDDVAKGMVVIAKGDGDAD